MGPPAESRPRASGVNAERPPRGHDSRPRDGRVSEARCERCDGGINDPEASGEALRHVLIGGVHSVEDFAVEVAEAEGGEPLPAHEATKIIGEVLTELDS